MSLDSANGTILSIRRGSMTALYVYSATLLGGMLRRSLQDDHVPAFNNFVRRLRPCCHWARMGFAGNKPLRMFRSETSQKWRKSGAKVAHTRTAAQLPYQVVTDVLRLATAVAREGISTERLSDRGKLAKRCSVLGEQADEIVGCRLSRVRCECSFWLV
jgi:hypothetical protein